MERKTVGFQLTSLDTEGRTLEGYASTFGNLDLGDDIIHPGAFAKTLAERGGKVRFLWQHDPSEPLGKPIELHEDARGLFFKAVISDTARGRDALALLRDGAIEGLSIGYEHQRRHGFRERERAHRQTPARGAFARNFIGIVSDE